MNLKDLKVAYFTDDGVATPTKEIIAAVQNSAKALSDAGVKVEENRPADMGNAGKVYHDMKPRRRRCEVRAHS